MQKKTILNCFKKDVDERKYAAEYLLKHKFLLKTQQIKDLCQNEEDNIVLAKLLCVLQKRGSKDIKKIEFIKTLDKITPLSSDVKIYTFLVAGASFRYLGPCYGNLQENSICYLVRDKYNRYDKYAVKVVTDFGYVIGFIPKDFSKNISAYIKHKKPVYAKVSYENLANNKIEIEVYVRED